MRHSGWQSESLLPTSLFGKPRSITRRAAIFMSDDWNHDDLARLLALEHAFYSLALISASNFAYLANTTPDAAVKQFRSAVEGSMLDTKQYPPGTQQAMREHLKRMFDHVASMAKQV